MKNPFGDQKIPGSYHNLPARLYKKVSAQVSEQIFDSMLKACETAFYEENIVLSRVERKRLFSQIIQMLMEDMTKRLDDSPKGN